MIDSKEVKEKTYLRYEFVNSKLLFVIREPFQSPSVFPIFCYLNETAPSMKSRIYGLTRNLKGIQKDINIRNSQMHDIVESQINSGWIYTTAGVENPEALQGASQGKAIIVADMNALRKIEASPIPPSHAQSIQLLVQLADQISGVGSEDLVSTSQVKSGLSIMLQQESTNQHVNSIIENIEDAQMYIGKILGYLVQLYSPNTIAKMLNKPLQELDVRLFLRTYIESNLMLATGKSSNTQRQKTLNELVELRKIGVQIPDSLLIKYSSITNKADVLKELEQIKQQTQQLSEQQRQIEVVEKQAEIEKTSSSAFKERTQGVKNLADAQESREKVN